MSTMKNDLVRIAIKVEEFYLDIVDMPDVDIRLTDFLFSEILNDLSDKKIKNFNDWLKYYSTDGNDFEEILALVELYYVKSMKREFDLITMQERILIYNAIALYSLEMDVERQNGKILNEIIATFIEIVRNYNLFLKGYLLLEGDVLISDRNKIQFYTVWSAGSVNKKLPITLFKSEK